MTLNNIIFQEDDSSGYKSRTVKNASADVTIAIAYDFNSAGEKLTKQSVISQEKLYLPVDINSLTTKENISSIAKKLSQQIKNLNKKEIILNIAGNGLYTLRESSFGNQNLIDVLTYTLLENIVNDLKGHLSISTIRTGGQTGFDEAGAKAGVKLGIPTLVLAPKGWTFRGILAEDISNEEQFKKRFAN